MPQALHAAMPQALHAAMPQETGAQNSSARIGAGRGFAELSPAELSY